MKVLGIQTYKVLTIIHSHSFYRDNIYPVDGLKQFDVHWIAGELALDLDEGVTGGHGLDQEAVCGQSLRIRNTLRELSLSGLANCCQVQVSFCQGSSLK